MRYDGFVRFGSALAVLLVAVAGAPLQAQQAVPHAPPGVRPESPHATEFLESLDAARIVVLPSVVRGVDRIRHSVSSQKLIVELLAEGGLATATTTDRRVDLGVVPHQPQWEIFQSSLRTLATALEARQIDADYALVMEVVLPPGAQVVFGIETYILDRQGRNVFSFLLNAHHEVFTAANLVAADETAAALETMVLEATRVGIAALQAQVDHARECVAWMVANPPQAMAVGVFEDFQVGIPTVWDPTGIALGFSTFSGPQSTVRIDTTSSHPPRAGEGEGNTTLRVDLDVISWAGFVYLPHEASTRTWRAQDWTAFQGLSFWMYGTNTGTQLFVDVLDNRNPCSQVDDAERYVYEFADDFSGWKQIVVPFSDMVRKEIWNDAPNDGLGLARVHGWAFGAATTNGPRTWYLDAVALWADGAGGPLQRGGWRP
jgi:hypothetical protein